jgi:hypothetical protein
MNIDEHERDAWLAELVWQFDRRRGVASRLSEQ